MEKGIDAVFYNFKYYILPEEYADLTAIENGAEIKAKRLKEELCMAPDFIYESMQEETLTVENVKLLFPVKVNLYTHEEYDEILREQVHRVCPGCTKYYDEDDPSLDGHHREISLGGVCYEREEGKSGAYSVRVWWFYKELKCCLDALAKCIDKGDQKKFDKICKECARSILDPEQFVGGVEDGKYCIYMQAGLKRNYVHSLQFYTATVGGQKNIGLSDAGWKIYPYLPAGVKKYKGKIKDETLLAALVPIEECSYRYEVKLHCKDKSVKKRQAALKDFCEYLTDKVGEKALLNGLESIEFVDGEEDYLTAAQIVEKFSVGEKEDDLLGKTFPPSTYLGWSGRESALPHRRSCSGVTVCSDFTSIAADINMSNDIAFCGVLVYAYVFVPATEDTASQTVKVVGEYLSGESKVPEPVLQEKYFTPSFIMCGSFVSCSDEGVVDGVTMDFLVTDEKAFFRFMKILAPVLTSLNARIVVVNDDGAQEYKPGFVIEPADGETAN